MIKISTRTIISHIIDSTISEWKIRLPDKHLEEYDNWKEDTIDKIAFQLNKKGFNIDEVIIENEEEI